MKSMFTPRILLFTLALLFSLTSLTAAADGQPRKGRARPAGTLKKKTIPPKAVVNSAVTTSPSGLVSVITRQSNGRQPLAGETVVVQYTGLLGSGAKFDSSLDRAQPFSFKLGTGQVIKGWDEGIAGLRVGEQATLIIPPQLGYGARAVGPIPPDSTLIFIVELISIEEAPASSQTR